MHITTKQIWIIFALVGVLCCCASPPLYLTVGRKLDYEVCMSRMATKLGIEPNIGAVYQHILRVAPSGLSHGETLNALKQIGSITVVDSTVLAGTFEIRETLRLDICTHPLNNIVFFAIFSPEGNLTDIVIPAS